MFSNYRRILFQNSVICPLPTELFTYVLQKFFKNYFKLTMDENMKTVFVLDHTPYFGISGEDPFYLDLKGGKVAVKKSLWTSSVESSVEYCRIIWDLFPTDGKLIRFVISDKAAHIVNTWDVHTQNLVSC